ncbi:hypothetical protein QTP88_018234 [Uroleucon formosanum]
MVTELQLNNEKLQIQISETIAGSSKESMSLPKKSIKVTKEVAKTSVKIHKPPPITICGHFVHNVTNIQIKNKMTLTTSLVIEIFGTSKKNKEAPQCKNYQIFGHTQNYCFKTPKCVKCSEGHTSLNCPKSKKSKAKCVNCGEGHTANWKGCITYKNALEKAYPKKTTAVLFGAYAGPYPHDIVAYNVYRATVLTSPEREMLSTLGSRFIAGRDYNAKHTFWISRLITTKGRELFKSANTIKAQLISTIKSTYWSTDPNKLPDVIDFYVMKGISSNYTEVEGLLELTGKKSYTRTSVWFRNKHSTIDQVHRVTNVISKALEEKKYCCGVFLDVAQAFDKVWHKGLLIKLREQLPHTWCALLESYLADRQFRVIHKEAITEWKDISAGVPQGSVLGPILYLLYTADIPNDDNITLAMFADDTAILSTRNSQFTATDNLQKSIDNIFAWTRRWKIKINSDKSVQVNYTLRKTENIQIVLNKSPIPQKDSAKYLGMHLDSLGAHSELTIENKRLLYVAIIKPIWIYGIQLWGCASKSNIDVIQRCQNIALRTITAAYRFERNNAIHRDMMLPTIADEIQRFARKHEMRLDHHINPLAIQLLDNSKDIRRLKRLKPYDLV